MFTTRAVVYVADPVQRDMLISWLENLGYDAGWGFRENRNCVAVNIPQGRIMVSTAPPQGDGIIDCKKDVSLFRALASMNDAWELNQWYVCHTPEEAPVYAFAHKGGGLEWINMAGTFHKATARELCYYFNMLRHKH